MTKYITKKGFSLGEVIIAVAIVATGLIGTHQAITRSLSYSLQSRDEVIASNLAQEGIELVRNIRDGNILDQMDSGISGTFDGIKEFKYDVENYCAIDTHSLDADGYPEIKLCGSGPINKKRLYLDNNRYGNTLGAPGVETKFYRQIKIDEKTEDEIYEVTVEVDWNSGAFSCPGPKCIKLVTILTNWDEETP